MGFEHGKTIGLIVLNSVVDYILFIFFDDFKKYLLNVTPIDELKATLGLIFLVGATISGMLLVQHILNIKKKKPIDVPPRGIRYEQILCLNCNHPNVVYPPLKKYKEIVFNECEDKEGEADHNLKIEIKCTKCHKKFGFYWCTGHFHVEGVPKRRFNR